MEDELNKEFNTQNLENTEAAKKAEDIIREESKKAAEEIEAAAEKIETGATEEVSEGVKALKEAEEKLEASMEALEKKLMEEKQAETAVPEEEPAAETAAEHSEESVSAEPASLKEESAEAEPVKEAEAPKAEAEKPAMEPKEKKDEFERTLDEVFANDQRVKRTNDYYEKIQVREANNKGMLRNIVGLILAFALAFGGGYIGTKVAQKSNPSQSVIHEVEYVESPTQQANLYQPANENTIPTVVEKYADTVVEIKTEAVSTNWFMQQYVVSGAGSGVIITSDGYILTCNHVIKNAKSITVRLTDGTEYPATVIGTYADTDLAVIKVDATNLHAVTLGSSNNLKVGQSIIAIGNPLGSLGGSVTSGIVSAKERQITIDGQEMTLLQIDAPISPGNSGGALMNLNGELVGIVNAKTIDEDVEGIGFAIPLDDVKNVINDLVTQGYVTGRRAIGIKYANITSPDAAEYYNLDRNVENGIYIVEIQANSLAEELGMQVGDKILSINNKSVNTLEDLGDTYTALEAGAKVNIVCERDGREISFDFIRG